jgi:hypothetical protein
MNALPATHHHLDAGDHGPQVSALVLANGLSFKPVPVELSISCVAWRTSISSWKGLQKFATHTQLLVNEYISHALLCLKLITRYNWDSCH